jgi:Cu+-exporting ATPase
MEYKSCYHCGNDCDTVTINYDEKDFCCNGCKTVYEIFSENDLTCYYDLQNSPGAIPSEIEGKYDFLDNEKIKEKLLEFNDDKVQIVTLYIPHIHCSSCIWILENLNKLNKSISSSQVNFNKKTVRVVYDPNSYSLKELVKLMSSIGYEPYITLDDFETRNININRSLLYKLGISGFAFGNIMFLSFPEYFQVDGFWIDKYKHFFRLLMFVFSIPVVFYAAQDYFISAFKGLRSKLLNIDVPIALGISVLFIRSTIEISFDLGSGFFDSLTGLVFFLLIGKYFQQKTYSFLSFERDYKSYFPIAITRISNGKEENIQVYDIEKGDRLVIRNEELIPVDGILINGNSQIDYSFVTGESSVVFKDSGDKIFAGGKQTAGVIEMEALKSVQQSYLTQLWSNDVFKTNKVDSFSNLTNNVSKHFTVTIISIAIVSTVYWLIYNPDLALNVFTAVLIIACPCALALSAPFTFGNLLRILGKKKFYLKNTSALEQLANIDTIIFDKTGTITTSKSSSITYEGIELTQEEEELLKSTLRGSNHPLSRALYNLLEQNDILTLDSFEESTGEGIHTTHDKKQMKVGSASFVGNNKLDESLSTSVHVSSDNIYKGKFVFKNIYREGLIPLFKKLSSNYNLVILSGDNEGEIDYLKDILPKHTQYYFNQKPEDKLEYIKSLQKEGEKVLMIGDGLNDAGALAQSNVGIAISENINVFSPACDAILDSTKFEFLWEFLKASKSGINVIKLSFVLSFIYNILGLYFAVTGQLSPVVAAILMPLSSISIVVFTTVSTNILGKKINDKF